MEVIMALIIIYSGIQSWRGKEFHLPPNLIKQLQRFRQFLPKKIASSFFFGLGSIFLPCGLLYTILGSLIVLEDPFKTALVMTFFWAVSVLALSLMPEAIRKGINLIGWRVSTVQGILFTLTGCLALVSKFYPIASLLTGDHAKGQTGNSCH